MAQTQHFISTHCAATSVGHANQLLTTLIQTLLTAQCAISPSKLWPSDYGPTALKNDVREYDFIIIGGGSAGATVAGRLSEEKKWKVLLLEAGGDPPIESEVPGMALTLKKTRVDWKFPTKSSNACKSSAGGCDWSSGKCLGGSGAINSLMYVRGNKIDFAEWEQAGNTGWDFESVLPYFKKSESQQQSKFVKYDGGRYHNASGPLKIDYIGEMSDIHKALYGAGVERGHPFVDDINESQLFGYVNSQGTYANARRQSAAKAFLIPAKDRTNLHVIKNGFVKKILINKKNRAYGVSVEINKNNAIKFLANKEVILSAGSVMSSVLLKLSGIGPREELAKLNIPLKTDSPVGSNLLDHIYSQMWFKFKAIPSSPLDQLDYLYQFLTRGTGPLAHPTQLSAFLSTISGTSRPEYQINYVIGPQNSTELTEYIDNMRFTPAIRQTLLDANKDHGVFVSGAILLHPHSKGHIELNGTNARNKPKIYPNYLSNQTDVKLLARAVKEQVSYVDTKAYKTLGIEFIRLPLPECDKYQFQSDEYWQCYVQHISMTLNHPVGTSKMGPTTDPKAVVNLQLKIYGVDGLRQIDAGIMPTLVSGNTNAATIMIAEKGADLIKNEYLNVDTKSNNNKQKN